jgi:hypothetical protein
LAAAQLDALARLGRETAAAAEAAERRRPLAGNVHGLLCAAHESLLRLNELSLEAVSVPLLASQLRSALRQSLVDLATATAAPAREARRRQLEAADVSVVDALRSAPSPVLLARLAATAFDVNVTERVERERETGRAEGEGEGERMLQAAVSELSDTADRLVATRSVLHIAVAVREAAALMEGHVLAEEGRALRRAVAQLIPDADAAASPASWVAYFSDRAGVCHRCGRRFGHQHDLRGRGGPRSEGRAHGAPARPPRAATARWRARRGRRAR